MIKVYTTDSCPWCDKAKNYLKSQNLEYTELNVQDDMEARDEMIKKSRQNGRSSFRYRRKHNNRI